MKRRTKIITTIASLCLALSLMVFGVYAASSASFTLSSSVTYECSDVFVDIVVTYYLVAGSGTALSSASSTFTGKTYSGSGTSKTALESISWDPSAPTTHTATFTSSNKCAAIKIVLTNQNSNTDAKFKISALPTNVTNTSFTLKYNTSASEDTNYSTANTYVTLLKSGTAREIVYRRVLTDTSKSVGSTVSTWSATVTIENGAAS